MEELNSGPPKTNPSSGREQDLNPGRPDYKSSAQPLGHAASLKTLLETRQPRNSFTFQTNLAPVIYPKQHLKNKLFFEIIFYVRISHLSRSVQCPYCSHNLFKLNI